MCGRMTKDDLEVFKNKVVSAHTDYTIADDPVTFEQLILSVQDMYMALMEERTIQALG